MKLDLKERLLKLAGAALALGGVALLFLLFRSGALPLPGRHKPTVGAGMMAADFTLTDLDGHKITLSELRGKVVFLNIWATWCAPCRREMPSIEKLYQQFGKRSDFVILAVSQDDKGREVVAQYVHKHDLHFPVLLDPANLVGQAYNVSGVPETFIIGRDGRIIAHHLGAFDWSRKDFRQALVDLLDQKAG